MANPALCSFIFFTFFFINFSFAPAFLKLFAYSEDPPEKSKCYNDIDSGLWGEKCMASMMERENCYLRCLSPTCYDLIYQNDPLEEGERDQIRSQEYIYCMRRVQGYGDQLIVTNTGGYFTISQDHQSG